MAAALTIARAYQHSFESHPNTTLAITGGCFNTIADIVAQVSQNTVRPGLSFGVFIDIPLSVYSGGKNMRNTVVMTLHAVYAFFVMALR